MAELSEIIKRQIVKTGKSKAYIANMLGVGEKTVENYMNSKRQPRPDVLIQLAKILEFSLSELSEQGVPKESEIETTPLTYLEKRRNKKSILNVYMVPLVPVKAQAGYSKSHDQIEFLEALEKYPLLPGISPIGANWRYFEVEGTSMEPTLQSGDLVLTSQIHQMDWENLRNFYIYVLVTNINVLIKRVVAKNPLEWVLISDNENEYPQQLLSVEDVKEVWVLRRHIKNNVPPPKMFDVKL